MMASNEGDAQVRGKLASRVVWVGLVGVTIAAAIALWLSKPDNRPEMARLIFASILPLYGTWVGTVLAFYFARENLQAAAESTAQLFRRLEPNTPVTEVMIPRPRMIVHKVVAGGNAADVRLADLHNRMNAAGVSRLPILSDTEAVLYVVHQATIDRFAGSLAPPVEPAALTQTLDNLLADSELKQLISAIAFIGPNAVIQDARKAMRATPSCNDVFVTSSGGNTDPVKGWLTNTDLAGME
jgi:hypothetical protein